jgi:acyl carrier protein
LPPLEDRLRQFIQDNLLFGQSYSLKSDDSFLEKGIIDSTGVLELVSFIEKEFAIRVMDEELIPENLDSFANLTRFIQNKQAAKKSA